MTKIIKFPMKKTKFHEWAITFIQIFKSDGLEKALLYLSKEVPPQLKSALTTYIDREFISGNAN